VGTDHFGIVVCHSLAPSLKPAKYDWEIGSQIRKENYNIARDCPWTFGEIVPVDSVGVVKLSLVHSVWGSN